MSEDYTGRNGHLPPKTYNDRGSNKWYNDKRNSRRDYRESSERENRDRGSDNNSNNGGAVKPTQPRSDANREREMASADRESNSSVENTNSRRRTKARNHSSKFSVNTMLSVAI